MEKTTERNTRHIIAGVFGLIAIALVIIGALVVVDQINLAGTNQASMQQRNAPSPNAAPAPPPAKSN
jgi:hypothetical protein